jgi:signal transduction histidine kinase
MNRLKSEFLANVSHELRTPLNAISGYTELIAEEIYGPITPQQKEALGGVDESSRNLITLINQILDLSKVESGKIEVYMTEVAIHDVAQAVASEAAPVAKDRPYRVEIDCPERIVVKTDRAKVQQIVTNLVANAVKFTERGSVKVACRPIPAQEGGGCTISITDTGIGIRPEHLEIIFEEFRQVDGSSTRIYQGTGLGLSIARRFARILGGDVTVTSKLGVGSTFVLRLPAEAPALVPMPAPPPRRGTGQFALPPAIAAAASSTATASTTGERPKRTTLPPLPPPDARRQTNPRIPITTPPGTPIQPNKQK